MAIKKAYTEIVELLEANADVKVKKILAEVIALASAKTAGAGGVKQFIKDQDGNVVAIHDYYFKRWMPVVGDMAVAFGSKAGSATGLSNMSKEGTSLWTKQQRTAKNSQAEMLTKLESGELLPGDIADERSRIEEARKIVEDTQLGYATKDEVVDYLYNMGVEIPESELGE